MKTTLLTCLVMFWVCHAFSSTYYVSSNGQNSNSGSELNPWKTLQHAADEVVAGDTVIVKAGNYTGFVLGWDDNKSGNSNDPIVFKAQPGVTIISKNSTTNDGINLEGSSYIVIDGFTITNTAGTITRAGIRSVTNTGVVIRNNTISGMGTWGIFTGFSANILIENNSCSNSIEEHGIYHSNSGDNPIIRNNVSFNNNGCGIHMNGDASEGDDGIISNALVEGNIIYNNGNNGGSGINCDGVQNSVIRNNLLYNNHASGISLFRQDGAQPSINNSIINNTIYMAEDGRWAVNIGNSSINNKVINNILFTKHSFRGSIDCESNSLPGFKSDYNILMSRFTTNGGDEILDFEEWKALTNQDKNSIISEPNSIFLNVSGNDFHLKAGSVAINNGTSDNAPSSDIEGHYRPFESGIDRGAYEYIGNVDIIETRATDKLQIYPNPAKDFLIVNSEKEIICVDIIDLFGRTRLHFNFDSTYSELIHISDLEDGSYIARVLCKDGNMYNTKILK